MAPSSPYALVSLLLAIALVICTVNASSSTPASGGGFTVELIHRDSPKSPYYNPTKPLSERLRADLHRSSSRANYLSSRANPNAAPVSKIFHDYALYLMNISIGSPPFPVVGIFDTSIDFSWVQCRPCDGCSGFTGPLFDPSSSSTYQDLFCYSKKCTSLPHTRCDPAQGKICQYHISYTDKTFTEGNVATDSVTLSSTSGKPISFPQILIGCSHHTGRDSKTVASGAIGFGPQYTSFLSQIGTTVGKRFSYCLVPTFPTFKGSSKLNLGSSAVVQGPGVVSTPLGFLDGLYALTLKAVSVGPHRYEVEDQFSLAPDGANIVIDSVGTASFLPPELYLRLESAVASQIKLERVPDPLKFFRLCYNTTTDVDAPIVTMHFKGADVKLGPANTFIRVSEHVACFAFSPSECNAWYGTHLQVNFLVLLDVEIGIASFKPSDCAKS